MVSQLESGEGSRGAPSPAAGACCRHRRCQELTKAGPAVSSSCGKSRGFALRSFAQATGKGAVKNQEGLKAA